MNWVANLIDLYDKNQMEIGKIVTKEYKQKDKIKKGISYTLLPVAHTTALAQIEVTIDTKGNFLRSRILDKSEAFTIIPCTVSSGSRAGAVTSPHPLCDNLKYIAGDYNLYSRVEDKNCEEKYEKYIAGLKEWSESSYSHPKVRAIYQYLYKRCLMHDLVKYHVIQTEEDGLAIEAKIQAVDQMDAFVRFCVEPEEMRFATSKEWNQNGSNRTEVWLDRTLIQCFINYYENINAENGLCYLTGKKTFLSEFHPKKIRNDGDGAKLISGNDNSGFTYRGRFDEKSEAMGMGFEESQKAHNALKWIIRKQGYNRDGMCIVTWASDMIPPITPYDSITQLMGKISESDVQEELEEDDMPDLEESEEEENYNTKEMNARSLSAAIEGYRLRLKNSSNMIVMSFDAATPGRLAITYYKELDRSDYLKNIEYWQKTCSWLHEATIDKKRVMYYGMPSLNELAYILYGTEQEEKLVLHSNSDGKMPMMVSTFQRLMPCILERKSIPKDMVQTAINRASMPQAYTPQNWRRVLAVACSMVKKSRYDYGYNNIGKEEWNVDTDMSKIADRNFLYGRLLAIADRIEYTTYEKEEKSDASKQQAADKRVTNAKRYMNRFSQRPYSTWSVIEDRIQPYLQKNRYRQYYEHQLDEVMCMFSVNEFSDDSRLDGLYLLGFHMQSQAFRTKKEHVENSVVHEQEGEYGDVK